MNFEDLFGNFGDDLAKNLSDNNGDKQEQYGNLPVEVNPKSESNNPRKEIVYVNILLQVATDENGNPIKSWVSRERQIIAHDILDNLKKKNVEIFNTNGYLSAYDKSTDNWYLYDDASKVGVLVDSYILCLRKYKKRQIVIEEPIDCPKNVNEYLTHSRELIGTLPKVIGVARHPYFDNSLNIVNYAGYNKDTQYYLPESCTIEKDAHSMTIKEAYDVFEEAFGSMNYREEVDRQADFACFLTPPWRMVIGNSPIVSVTSNSPGSGKGLRQTIFNSVWTNDKGAVISKPRSEDELKKQLFASLRSGITHVAIDNISQKLLSDVLATYSTMPHMSDRAVYGKTIETYKNDLFISVNGNHLRFSEDLATRLLPIHLDINESSLVRNYKAEGRKTETEILNYAKKNRDKIIGASLRISQEYIDKGMPEQPTGESRFEKWKRCVLGSVYYSLDCLNIDYLLNGFIIDAKRAADPESQARGNLFKAILDVIGLDEDDNNKSKPFTSANHEEYGVFDLASHYDKVGKKEALGHDILGEYIDGRTERSRMTQVGVYFRDKAIDKIHYGWRLIKEDKQLKVNRAYKPTYRLVLVAKENTKFYVPGTENWERPQEENNSQQTNQAVPTDDTGIGFN